MPASRLCNNIPKINGYCVNDETTKVIDAFQLNLDNFVISFFERRMQSWPFPCS